MFWAKRVTTWLAGQFDAPVDRLAGMGVLLVGAGVACVSVPAALVTMGALLYLLALRLLTPPRGGA